MTSPAPFSTPSFKYKEETLFTLINQGKKSQLTALWIVFFFQIILISETRATSPSCLNNFTSDCVLNEAIDRLRPFSKLDIQRENNDQSTKNGITERLFDHLSLAVIENKNSSLDRKLLNFDFALMKGTRLKQLKHSLKQLDRADDINEILQIINEYSIDETRQTLLKKVFDKLYRQKQLHHASDSLEASLKLWDVRTLWPASLHYLHLLTTDVMIAETQLWEKIMIKTALSTENQSINFVTEIAKTQILNGDFKSGLANLTRLRITSDSPIEQIQNKKQCLIILDTLRHLQKITTKKSPQTVAELLQAQIRLAHSDEQRHSMR
ncbi:MAG: hypothetical protein JKY67_20420, partial [Pseudomonadales bacterium]|nr:hypothetical protein [Pseudomonadales bacterium]